jgi:DNA-binding PadR family transcriptional regulator
MHSNRVGDMDGSGDASRPEAVELPGADLGALLPLSPAVFYILLALAGGERHGYAIMREVAGSTGGQVRLGPGILYRSIKQMLGAGLIDEAGERPDPALDDERRRYYRLTAFGRRVAQAEAERLAGLVRLAEERRLYGAGQPGDAAIEGGGQ